jgi:circadian clock protein KaiC
MEHSKQVREFIITSDGLKLIDVYRRPEGEVLVGSARLARLKEMDDGQIIKTSRHLKKAKTVKR